MPVMDEIFRLTNESLPNHKLDFSRPDSDNDEGLDEIYIEDFTWYNIGKIVQMLKKLQSKEGKSSLGKPLSTRL